MTVFRNVKRGQIPARLPVAHIHALADQGVLGEDDAFELVEGEIVPLAAAKASPHEMMKSRLIRWLARNLPGDLDVKMESSIAVTPNSLLGPDIAVWPRDIGCREVTGPEVGW